jgi:nucleotide-binding universal stress UspA family protein
MYTNILIPTDGSELAGKAIPHGIALAKRVGAKVTGMTVLQPFHTLTTDTQMIGYAGAVQSTHESACR